MSARERLADRRLILKASWKAWRIQIAGYIGIAEPFADAMNDRGLNVCRG